MIVKIVDTLLSCAALAREMLLHCFMDTDLTAMCYTCPCLAYIVREEKDDLISCVILLYNINGRVAK